MLWRHHRPGGLFFFKYICQTVFCKRYMRWVVFSESALGEISATGKFKLQTQHSAVAFPAHWTRNIWNFNLNSLASRFSAQWIFFLNYALCSLEWRRSGIFSHKSLCAISAYIYQCCDFVRCYAEEKVTQFYICWCSMTSKWLCLTNVVPD